MSYPWNAFTSSLDNCGYLNPKIIFLLYVAPDIWFPKQVTTLCTVIPIIYLQIF